MPSTDLYALSQVIQNEKLLVSNRRLLHLCREEHIDVRIYNDVPYLKTDNYQRTVSILQDRLKSNKTMQTYPIGDQQRDILQEVKPPAYTIPKDKTEKQKTTRIALVVFVTVMLVVFFVLLSLLFWL